MNFHINSLPKQDLALAVFSFAILGASLAKVVAIGVEVSLPSAESDKQATLQKEGATINESVSSLFRQKGSATGGATSTANTNALKLKAIFKSGSKSFAMLESGGESFFLELNEIKNGVKLEKILYEKVAISRGGERLELSLEYAYFPNAQKTAADPLVKTAIVSKEMLGSYIQNPSAMMEDVRLDVKNGAVFIASLKGGTLFDIAGFRQNDVILSLDGVMIKNPVELVGALKNLTAKSSFSAQIDRNGVKKEMKYEIK